MQKEIRHTWQFRQSPEEVWQHLTKPELMEQWLMKSDFQPVVGHQFRFVGGCHDNDESQTAAYCEVLEVSPYSRLSYSWKTTSLFDSQPFNSKVEWTLTETSNGTELQLVHDGFTALEDRVSHNDGWTRLVNQLAESLNAVPVDSTNA